MGVSQKAPDALIYKRGGRYRPLQIMPAGDRPVPACPDGLSERARETWEALWSSKLAGAYGEVDALVLGRWLTYLDQWKAAKADVEEQGRTVRGRRGGEVVNPNLRIMLRLEGSLRELEKCYGLDPMSRLRLGVSLAEAYDPVRSLKAAAAIKQYKDRLEQS